MSHKYLTQQEELKLDGIVYFRFGYIDDATKDVVRRALMEIEQISYIKFTEVNPEEHSGFVIEIRRGKVWSNCAKVYSDAVWRKPHWIRHMKRLTIDDRCKSNYETIMHELFHVLGFIHENRRNDWAQHITYGTQVNVTNQLTAPTAKFDKSYHRIMDTTFDPSSIMTYGVFELGFVQFKGMNARPVEGKGLSRLDAYRLNRLYKCPDFHLAEPQPNTIVEYKLKPCMDPMEWCKTLPQSFCEGKGTIHETFAGIHKYIIPKRQTIIKMQTYCPLKCKTCSKNHPY